jgi:putative flippase GtrA
MSPAQRFLKFNGVGALGIGVQLAVVSALVGWWRVGAAVATAAGVSAAVVQNFIWHFLWTWGDRRGSGVSAFAAFARFAAANGAVSLVGNTTIVWALVSWTPMGGVIANIVAIAVCGLVNYSVTDRVVFRLGTAVRECDS